MKQLLLATAALIGMSSAAFAAEPVALTDAQLDKVTAGLELTIDTVLIPISFLQGGLANSFGIPVAAASGFTTNLALQHFELKWP